MACLLVPATEALVVTIAKHRHGDRPAHTPRSGISMQTKLTWLTTMLWGGALLLLLEHIWHGDMTWAFPFFVGGVPAMLRDMATTGVVMALVVTAVWGLMVWAVEALPRLAAAVTPTA